MPRYWITRDEFGDDELAEAEGIEAARCAARCQVEDGEPIAYIHTENSTFPIEWVTPRESGGTRLHATTLRYE